MKKSTLGPRPEEMVTKMQWLTLFLCENFEEVFLLEALSIHLLVDKCLLSLSFDVVITYELE